MDNDYNRDRDRNRDRRMEIDRHRDFLAMKYKQGRGRDDSQVLWKSYCFECSD